jgi:diguanylate cyclase (GGDEF)-like protein/PAS domain S-box-containing protein
MVNVPPSPNTPRFPDLSILIGLGYFLAAAVAITLTRGQGSIAIIWPANGIVAALLIRAPKVHWWRTSASVLIAALLVNLLIAHRPWSATFLFTGVNGAEIALSVWMFRSLMRYDYPSISINESAIMAGLFGIANPGVLALAGGAALHAKFGTPYLDGVLQWWGSHTVGACLVGPPIILWHNKALGRLLSKRFVVENAVIAAAVMLGCWASISYVRFPFVSIGVLLLIAAFRVGGFGAALLSLTSGIVIAALWAKGVRPLGLERVQMDLSLVGLPIIALLATTMPPIAVGLGTDARRAVTRKLAASERRFRESMEHSAIGMLIANLDGHWIYTNIALQTMLGYSAEEFRAMPPGGPSEPEEWNGSTGRWQRLLSGEVGSYDVERRYRHKDGSWIWTHVAVSMVKEEGAEPYLIAQIESLQARRRAEEKLAEERERLRITLSSIDDAVITTDAQMRITYVNASAEAMLGLSTNAAQGRAVSEVMLLTDPVTSKAAANLIGQSAIHGRVFRRESACILHRPDGSLSFILDVVSPVLDTAGLVTGMVIVLRDASNEVSRSQELTHRANHDALTGLLNRAAFEQKIIEIFSRSHLLNRSVALLAIDLDRFKAVNDMAGHAAGDAVLSKVAEACRSKVRSSDSVARLGGDEFAIVLDNCSPERVQHISHELLQALNPLKVEWQGETHSVGASIGIALLSQEMTDHREWIAAADRACYGAKRGGRGRLELDRVVSAG